MLMTFMCLLWGLQQVAIKVALSHGLPPALQAGLRSLCSALCLAAWIGARGGTVAVRRVFVADGMVLPGLLMGAAFSVEFLLLYFGLSHTTASRGALFLYTSPFFVALGVHWLVPSERLGLRQVAGLLLAFAGVAVAVLDGLRGSGGTLLGDAMVTGTAIMWGGLTVAVRAVPVIRRNPPSRILMFQLLASVPLLFLFAAWQGELPALATASWIAYATLIYQSGVVAFATYLIWYWMMTIYPAGKLAAFSFLTPIFGLMAGATLLEEPVSAALIAALILVAGGLFLVNGTKTSSSGG
jgi:drug/metabolite transporter (DMT)-like permease